MTKTISDENTMTDHGFAAKFCKKYRCQPEEYEKKVLLRCLYALSQPLGRLIWLCNRDFFLEDLDLINELRDIDSFARVRDIVAFHSIQPRNKSILRRWFKIRVSKSKLLQLTRSVLRRSGED
jgi:hypothetical protein